MPNGHGGMPFMGGPVFLAVAFLVAALLPQGPAFGWPWVVLCLAIAALIGWRVAYHLYMRGADEYGGAYTSPEKYALALRTYRLRALAYAAVAAVVASGVLWWRVT